MPRTRHRVCVRCFSPSIALAAGALLAPWALGAAPERSTRDDAILPLDPGAITAHPTGIGPPPMDFGDAPDGLPACGIGGLGIGMYPTFPGTPNAVPGRDAPKHLMPGPGANVVLGAGITYEGAPYQPPCDWITFPCDDPGILVSDDSPLLLCLDPACASGVAVSAGVCGVGFGACFGPSPGAAPLGYWIISSARGPGAAGLPAFVNAVSDFDLSGDYGDAAAAWCIVDDPVPAIPGFYLHTSTPFPVLTVAKLPGGFWNIAPFWNRFLVSPEPLLASIPPGFWDGSGTFAPYPFGETEDWVVECDPGESFCAPPKSCFHSIATLVLTLNLSDPICQGPSTVVVNLNSAGLPSSMVREFRSAQYRDGGQIATELLQMELQGFTPMTGPVLLHERPDRMSLGLLRNIQAPGGLFLGGDSFFDVFVSVDLPMLGLQIDTGHTPIRMDAGHINQIPPIGSTYTSGNGQSVPLYIAGTPQQIGWLCHAEHTPTVNVPWGCPGDANGDRVVNFSDVTSVLANFGTSGPGGDANVDCLVNFSDITAVLANFGQVCPI